MVELPYLHASTKWVRDKFKELRPENRGVYAEEDKIYKTRGGMVDFEAYEGMHSDRKNRNDLEDLQGRLVWSLQMISHIHIPDEEHVKLREDWAMVYPQLKGNDASFS